MKIKTNREEGYIVMGNYHLKDRRLSLKAKGLLSLMLSLPDNWDYSTLGLACICIESRDTIRKILNELKVNKYLKIIETRDENGRYKYEYIIYEKPYDI
jgi:hypothetical protein